MRSETRYNTINSYVMLHAVYRFNLFGGRHKEGQGGPGFGGPGFGRPGMGGGRPGRPGGFGGGRRGGFGGRMMID